MDDAVLKRRLASMLRFDPAIRYVMLIGEDDKPLSSVSRRSDKSALEPPGQGNLVLRRFAIARGMASTSDSFYGPARFVILLREKLIEIVYLSAANMILVGADPDFPLEKVKRLAKVLDKVQIRSRATPKS